MAFTGGNGGSGAPYYGGGPAGSFYLTRPKNAPDPTDTHRAYITEGRRAATTRQRRTVAMLVSIVIGAVALSGLAIWQWRTAVEQRAEAQANAEQAKVNAAEAKANATEAT